MHPGRAFLAFLLGMALLLPAIPSFGAARPHRCVCGVKKGCCCLAAAKRSRVYCGGSCALRSPEAAPAPLRPSDLAPLELAGLLALLAALSVATFRFAPGPAAVGRRGAREIPKPPPRF